MELRRVERLKLREIANLELRSLKLDRKPVLRHATRGTHRTVSYRFVNLNQSFDPSTLSVLPSMHTVDE
jgi:hypothetical protein